MMTPHCDEVYIVNFKIYPLLHWSLSSRPQWPPAKIRHHQPIALSYWSESFNWGRLPSCVLMFALSAKYRLTSNEIFQLLGPAALNNSTSGSPSAALSHISSIQFYLFWKDKGQITTAVTWRCFILKGRDPWYQKPDKQWVVWADAKCDTV